MKIKDISGTELSDERVAGIQARNAARSPGPFVIVDETERPIEIHAADRERYPHPVASCAGYRCEADAAFFAAAPDDITDLLAERAMYVKLAAARNKEAEEIRSERDFLKRRERSIVEATEPADDGKYRADIAGAILRQRRQLDEARAEVDRLTTDLALQGDALLRWREMSGCDTPHAARELRAAALPSNVLEELRSFGPLADVATSLTVAQDDVSDLYARDDGAEERLRRLDRAIACLIHARALLTAEHNRSGDADAAT